LIGARLIGCDLRTYYSDPKCFSDGQIAALDEFGTDYLLSPFALAKIAEAFGSETRYFETHPPSMSKPAITDPTDILRLKMPDIDSNPAIVYFRESVRLMAKQRSNQTPVGAIVMGPWDILPMIVGLEKWMDTLFFEPDIARAVAESISGFFVDWCNGFLADGADFIAVVTALTSPETIRRDYAEKHVMPLFKGILPEIRGGVLIHHSGQRIEPFIDLYKDIGNVIGFALDSRDDPKSARIKAGPQKVLFYGPEGNGLPHMSDDEISGFCQNVLHSHRDDPHFILATSGPDIPYDTPLPKIHAFCDAAKEYSGINAPDQ
jgi:uroporphyrinogen decarboxylase